MSSQEEISEELCTEIIAMIEARTLDAGLSLEDAAKTCREVAQECRDRASAFDEEVNAK